MGVVDPGRRGESPIVRMGMLLFLIVNPRPAWSCPRYAVSGASGARRSLIKMHLKFCQSV